MKTTEIKDKRIKQLVELFESDSQVYKSFMNLIEAAPAGTDDKLLAAMIDTAKKRRPTSAKLKNFLASTPALILTKKTDETKPETKSETKQEPVLAEPFTVGAFHYNFKNEICEIKSIEHEIGRWGTETSIEYLNLVTLEYKRIESGSYDSINSSKYKVFFTASNKTPYSDIKNHFGYEAKIDFLFKESVPYKKVAKENGLLSGYKYLKPNISIYKTKIEKLNAFKTSLIEIKNEFTSLNCNVEELISNLKEKCIESTNCNWQGKLVVNGKEYLPMLYTIEDVLDFCKKNKLFLTKSGICNLAVLKNDNVLKTIKEDKYFLKYIPEDYNQIMIMIKLCVELDKIQAAKDSIEMIKEKPVSYFGLFTSNDKLLYIYGKGE